MVYYQENKIDKSEVQEHDINGYIVHFVLINQHNNSSINEQICCEDIKKLINFFQYVALPSAQFQQG